MPAPETDSPRPSWLVLFVLLSLLIHLVIGVAIIVIALHEPKPRLAPPTPDVSITLVPPLPATPAPHSVFLPTEPDPLAKPHKSLIESDNDNRLRSQNQTARNKESILPDVTGKKRDLDLHDRPPSPPTPKATAASPPPAPKSQPQKPTPPQPEIAQTPPQPQQPPQPPTKTPSPNRTKTPEPQVAKEELDPNGLPLLPPIAAPTLAPETPATPPVLTQTGRAARPPPSFAINKSDNSGAAGAPGDNSPAAMATELGRYKSKVYRAVGSRWYAKVNSQLQVLPVGIVHVSYKIYSDGHMEIMADPDANNATLMLLHSISLNSMIEAAPFEPFSDALKAQVGDSYTDDFSFSIYGG